MGWGALGPHWGPGLGEQRTLGEGPAPLCTALWEVAPTRPRAAGASRSPTAPTGRMAAMGLDGPFPEPGRGLLSGHPRGWGCRGAVAAPRTPAACGGEAPVAERPALTAVLRLPQHLRQGEAVHPR